MKATCRLKKPHEVQNALASIAGSRIVESSILK